MTVIQRILINVVITSFIFIKPYSIINAKNQSVIRINDLNEYREFEETLKKKGLIAKKIVIDCNKPKNEQEKNTCKKIVIDCNKPKNEREKKTCKKAVIDCNKPKNEQEEDTCNTVVRKKVNTSTTVKKSSGNDSGVKNFHLPNLPSTTVRKSRGNFSGVRDFHLPNVDGDVAEGVAMLLIAVGAFIIFIWVVTAIAEIIDESLQNSTKNDSDIGVGEKNETNQGLDFKAGFKIVSLTDSALYHKELDQWVYRSGTANAFQLKIGKNSSFGFTDKIGVHSEFGSFVLDEHGDRSISSYLMIGPYIQFGPLSWEFSFGKAFDSKATIGQAQLYLELIEALPFTIDFFGGIYNLNIPYNEGVFSRGESWHVNLGLGFLIHN